MFFLYISISLIICGTLRICQCQEALISFPVYIERGEGESIELVFSFNSERGKLVDSAVVLFCQQHSISRDHCETILDRALEEITSKSIELVEEGLYRSKAATEAYIRNSFRAQIDNERVPPAESSPFYSEESSILDFIFEDYLSSIKGSNRRLRRVVFVHSCLLPPENSPSAAATITDFARGSSYSNSYVLEEILASASMSGLLDEADRIWVVHFGASIDVKWLQRLYPVVSLIQYSHDVSHFEVPTLRLIKLFSTRLMQQNPDNKSHDKQLPKTQILYLHTKGVSFRDQNPQIDDWRALFLYFLVEKHEQCSHLLQSNLFDVVGVNFKFLQVNPPVSNSRFFSGNMWWATAEHISSLRLLSPNTPKYVTEQWVLSDDADPRIFSMHQSPVDHYSTTYPSSRYRYSAETEDNELYTASRSQLCVF